MLGIPLNGCYCYCPLDILLGLCAFASARWPSFSLFDPRGHLCNERRDTLRCNSIVEDKSHDRTSNSQCAQICSHCVLHVTGFLGCLKVTKVEHITCFPPKKDMGSLLPTPPGFVGAGGGCRVLTSRPNFWNWSLIFEYRRWRSLSKGRDFQVFCW